MNFRNMTAEALNLLSTEVGFKPLYFSWTEATGSLVCLGVFIQCCIIVLFSLELTRSTHNIRMSSSQGKR